MRVRNYRGIGALGLLTLSLLVSTDRGRAQDAGGVALWQKLRKLQTTASLLHTTAHPDDEQGGMLAMVSRGMGARTTLLTLTRGESGDNAIGSELFDALGLIRTEELRLADRYYGVDEQYFGTVVDYGFSKRLDEAFEKWGHDAALADVVRVIRIERPFVIVSRFQGTARDGHGNHMAAGVLTQEAFRAAADPKRFPEQIAEGLRPWQAFKLYMGARADDPWTLTIDPGRYDPALGQSYQNLARLGLAFQRSQNGGRVALQPGSAPAYFTRLDTKDAAKESSFFDGLDTTYAALPRLLHRASPAPTSTNRESGAAAAAPPEAIAPQVQTLLDTIDSEVAKAIAAFSMTDPAATVPPLTRGLTATRTAIARLGTTDPDIARVLTLKERQFCDAIVTALGIDLTAVAVPAAAASNGPGAALASLDRQAGAIPAAASNGPGAAAAPAPASPFAPPATLGPPVAGETFGVQASFVIRGTATTPIGLRTLDLITPAGWTPAKAANPAPASKPIENRAVMQRFEVTVPADAQPTRPPVSRDTITAFRYTPASQSPVAERHRPSAPPLLRLRAEIDVDGVVVDTDTIVTRRENRAPYGDVSRELAVVPAIAIGLSPAQAIVPISASGSRKPIDLAIDLINNDVHETRGSVALKLPAGWHAEPTSLPFTLAAGQRARLSASVTAPPAAVKPGAYAIEAIATVGSRTFSDGYDTLDHRDLETRYLYRPAATRVRALDVAIAPNLTVGYVMGIGDEVPAAIAQLGATVQLLDEKALTSAPLQNFNAIVLGTRAYAVRPDVIAANARLLDYAKNGGNLIVLYNTPELDPAKYAPFPGTLPQDAEEVSEEDAAVTILAPISPVLSRPNKITSDDFNGWIEQRGSKFWKTWDNAYTALLESHDRDQPPQRGGWLYVRYGNGHYSYVAYALHRQLPYGVPGAYRLLANLLSLGH